MTDPIYSVLYDISKAIVDAIAPVKDRIGSGHLAEGSVIQEVHGVLTERLHAAGFVRIDSIQTRESES